MDHLGLAEGEWLIEIGFPIGFKSESDGFTAVKVRLRCFPHKSGPQCGAQVQIFFSSAPHGVEDCATSFGLFFDELGVGM